MITKYFLVNDLEEITNIIIKKLCKSNIPYVYIKESNELHFDKYIFKFLTKNILFEFISVDEQPLPSNELVSLISEEEIINLDDTNTKKYNYNNIIKHNKETNMKLKKQYIPQKRFVRR